MRITLVHVVSDGDAEAAAAAAASPSSHLRVRVLIRAIVTPRAAGDGSVVTQEYPLLSCGCSAVGGEEKDDELNGSVTFSFPIAATNRKL